MLSVCASIRPTSFLPSPRAHAEPEMGVRVGKEGSKEISINNTLSLHLHLLEDDLLSRASSRKMHLFARCAGNKPLVAHLRKDVGRLEDRAAPCEDMLLNACLSLHRPHDVGAVGPDAPQPADVRRQVAQVVHGLGICPTARRSRASVWPFARHMPHMWARRGHIWGLCEYSGPLCELFDHIRRSVPHRPDITTAVCPHHGQPAAGGPQDAPRWPTFEHRRRVGQRARLCRPRGPRRPP